MKYEKAPDIEEKTLEIIEKLKMYYIKKEHISCIRSYGSRSNAIARCHALNKVMQKAMERKGFYVLEFISEEFDKLSEDEKVKIMIHELMHIPKTFGGGFRHHDYVNKRNVERMFQEFQRTKFISNKSTLSYFGNY